MRISDFEYTVTSNQSNKNIITLKYPEKLRSITQLNLGFITLPNKKYIDNIDFNDFMSKYWKYMDHLQELSCAHELDLQYLPHTIVSLICSLKNLSLLHEFHFLKILHFYAHKDVFNIVSESIQDLSIVGDVIASIHSDSTIKCPNLKKLTMTSINNKDTLFVENTLLNHPSIENLSLTLDTTHSNLKIVAPALRQLHLFSDSIDHLVINAEHLKHLHLHISNTIITHNFGKLDSLTIVNGMKTDFSAITTDKLIINRDEDDIPLLPKGYYSLKYYGSRPITKHFLPESVLQLALMHDYYEDLPDLSHLKELICLRKTKEKHHFKNDCLVLIEKLETRQNIDVFQSQLYEDRSGCLALQTMTRLIYKTQKNPPVLVLSDRDTASIVKKMDIYYGGNLEPVINHFFKDHSLFFPAIETIYAHTMNMTHIPPSTTTFIGASLLSDHHFNFKKFMLPSHQCLSDASPKMDLFKLINPKTIEMISFNLYDIVNWSDFLTCAPELQFLHITHKEYDISTDIPHIISNKLTYYKGFIGLGNVPHSLLYLHYNVKHHESIAHLVNLYHLRMQIHEHGDFSNQYVKSVELEFLNHKTITGILSFPNAEMIEIRVVKNNYQYVLEFLKNHQTVPNILVIWDYAEDNDMSFGRQIMAINSKIRLEPIYVYYEIY